MPSTTANLVTL